MSKKKPTVTLRSVADQFAAPNERIVEISHNGPGGYAGALISIRAREDGFLVVEVYRAERVTVAGKVFGHE